MKNIYLILGESGSGKTSIATQIEILYGMKTIQSYTTRPRREANETGHTFVTEKEFDELKDMVAYTLYNNYRYCATSQQVEDNDLYVIDIKGIEYFKQNYKGNKGVKIIYISSPIHTRVTRMEHRGDNFGMIMERIVNDVTDFKNAKEIADVIINNGDNTSFDSLIKEVADYIKITEELGEVNE